MVDISKVQKAFLLVSFLPFFYSMQAKAQKKDLTTRTLSVEPRDYQSGSGVNFSVSDAVAAERYWTPERMLDATPLDQGSKASKVGNDNSFANSKAAKPGSQSQDSEKKWIGVVYFVRNGERHSCTGSSIVSDSKSVVSTAAHCLYQTGNWASEVIFVPAWNGASRPLGIWGAIQYQVSRDWRTTQSIAHDAAFIKFKSHLDFRGKIHYLGDVDQTDPTPVSFSSAPPLLPYISYGYQTSVVSGKYSRQPLNLCGGTAYNHIGDSHQKSGALAIGGCPTEPGSSGGPVYLANPVPRRLSQVGVISSRGVSGVTPVMIFTPWGSVEYSLYKAVDNFPF